MPRAVHHRRRRPRSPSLITTEQESDPVNTATSTHHDRPTGLDPVGLVSGVALAVDRQRGHLVAIDLRQPGSRPRPAVLAEQERGHQNGDRTFTVRCPSCLVLHSHGGEPVGWRQADCPRGPGYFVLPPELAGELARWLRDH
jgi:hypothetical protein